MANTRSRKAASNRPGTARAKRPGEEADVADPTDEETAPAPSAAGATTGKSSTAKKAPPDKAKASTKNAAVGRRFGDGAAAGPRSGAPSTKQGGRGSRGGRSRPAPPVKVAQPKPWGMIVATVAVLVFAAGAIGYAVYEANSTSVPDSPEEIDGISVLEYAAGQEHVMTDVDYEETPPVGGPHDGYWADCDGAIYDMQVRSENAVHSLEHGAIWITYNPDDISGEDLAALSGYVENQPYTLLSPYAGLSSPISLQSWNHQLFIDQVDDPRLTGFIQVLRQNPEEYPEIGATCSQPTFLDDPVIEGEQSRTPSAGATDDPSAP